MSSPCELLFGPYRLDPVSGHLWRGRQVVPLTPKALAVLRYLADRPGQLVVKEEMLRAVWGDTLVTDASLKVAIREIRKALQDDPEHPRFIETAHRRGYRFVARVRFAGSAREDAPTRPPVPRSIVPLIEAAPILVGRVALLRNLEDCLEHALAGRRHVVFLTGESGSGKSTLLDVFFARVQQRGIALARGQCFEHHGRGEPYLPVLEALGCVESCLGQAAFAALLERQAPSWRSAVLRQNGNKGKRPAAFEATPERMLRELADFLEAVAAQKPLVLLLEDLHWCDYSTLDLFSALARRQTPARLLVLGTYRPVEVILEDHPLRSVKQELLAHRLCRELPLPPLDEAAIAEYLRQRFVARRMPASLAHHLHLRTDGLPLFLTHLVDYLLDRAILVVSEAALELTCDLEHLELDLPEGVRPLIEKQIDRLTPNERRVLEAAGVAGVEFSAAAIAAVLEMDIVAAEEVCEALAQRQQFLEARGVSEWPDGTVSSRYRFGHDLYHGAFYRRVPAARRVQYHRRLAERIEAAHHESADEVAAELALHFERGRDPARAMRWLRRAAERAARRYANREAADYFSRALAQVDRLPAPERDEARLVLLEQRGLVYRSTNDLDSAAADFRELIALTRRLGRDEKEIEALLYLASILSWRDRESCLSTVAEIVRLVPELRDPVQQAHARGLAAYWNLLWEGWSLNDTGVAAGAVAAARRAADPTLLAQHLGRFSFAQSLCSNYAVASASAEEGARWAQEAGDASEYLLCRYFEAWARLHHGDWAKLLQVLDEANRVAEENGHRVWALLFRLQRAWLHLHAQDFTTVEALCHGGVREADELKLPYAQMVAPVLLGFAHLGLRNQVAATACFEEIASRLVRERILLDWVWRMPLALGQAECALAQGDAEHATQAAFALCEIAADPGERTYLALGWRVRAEAALVRQRWSEAHEALAQATATLDGVHAPLAACRVLATASRLHELRGRSQDAAAAKRQSEELIHSLARGLANDPLLRVVS